MQLLFGLLLLFLIIGLFARSFNGKTRLDISSKDPIYLFVPHNTIYWVWMRLGPIGYLALWYLFGALIVGGCLIARQLRDPYLQLTAIYIIGVIFMEIIVAYGDYQLFSYRNVLYVGLLAGILMKLPEIDGKKEQSANEYTHGVPEYTVSNSRS